MRDIIGKMMEHDLAAEFIDTVGKVLFGISIVVAACIWLFVTILLCLAIADSITSGDVFSAVSFVVAIIVTSAVAVMLFKRLPA